MNKVEQKAKAIVEKAIKNNDFLDYEALVKLHWTDDVTMLVIVSPKGIAGKSTGIQKIYSKWLKNPPKWTGIKKDDFNAVWVRNTEEELKRSDVAASFTRNLTDNGFDLEKEWEVTNKGIFKKVDGNNRRAINLKKIAFADINIPLKSGSQNSLACDLFTWDECINPDFHKSDLTKDLFTLMDTYVRKKNGLAILLANAHESANDVFIELGISNMFDWESGKTQIRFDEVTGILAIFIEAYENKYLAKAKGNMRKIFAYSESVQNFMSGKVANNNSRGMVAWRYVKDDFVPIFKYFCNNVEYAVGTIVGGQYNGKCYVKQLKLQEYPDLVTWCYHVRDKRPWNWYVKQNAENANLSTVRHLLQHYGRGNLIFSSDWAQNEFISYVLPILNILMDD